MGVAGVAQSAPGRVGVAGQFAVAKQTEEGRRSTPRILTPFRRLGAPPTGYGQRRRRAPAESAAVRGQPSPHEPSAYLMMTPAVWESVSDVGPPGPCRHLSKLLNKPARVRQQPGRAPEDGLIRAARRQGQPTVGRSRCRPRSVMVTGET
jgi:hypothetical protein